MTLDHALPLRIFIEPSPPLDRPSQWPLNHRGAIVRLHSPLTESLPGSALSWFEAESWRL